MTTESTPSVFMVELDALFDTRLGTLITYMYDELQLVFSKGMYHDRLDDSFNKLVDKDVFYNYYAKRDKRVLANSTLSVMTDLIRDFIATTAASNVSSPIKYYPVVYINTYPYELNSAERTNIADGVRAYYKNKAVVELVHMDHPSITPDFLRKNITAVAMYEYHKWLDKQTETSGFKDTACSDVTLLGPRIFFKELPKTKKVSDQAFTSLEAISKPFINLELIPSMFYSTYLKPKQPA